MSEEKKVTTIVDMNPVTIEARANAAITERIKDEMDDGEKIAAILEEEYEKQGLEEGLSSEEAKEAAIDEMEKASQKALDAMRATGEDADKIVTETEEKLDDAFKEFRAYIKETTDPEKVKEDMKKFGTEVSKMLAASKESIEKTVNSEQFKSTMTAGKDFVVGTGNMIGDGLKYGYDKAMEVPEIKKVADKVDEGVDKIRQSNFLKDAVDNAEKGINDFNNFIFAGLHSFFSSSKPAPEKTQETPKTEDTTADDKKAE